MSYRRYVEDRTIDISKYPSYSKYKGDNVIKVPNYEKTSKAFNNLIPLTRFGVNPNDFNDEDEDMQRYGILGFSGVGNELEREVQAMIPGSQMRNIFPTHINDIVPKELRAVPTPFALAFADKNTFEATNPLLSTNTISGPLFSALAKRKLIESAAKKKKDTPNFRGPGAPGGGDGPPGGDNPVLGPALTGPVLPPVAPPVGNLAEIPIQPPRPLPYQRPLLPEDKSIPNDRFLNFDRYAPDPYPPNEIPDISSYQNIVEAPTLLSQANWYNNAINNGIPPLADIQLNDNVDFNTFLDNIPQPTGSNIIINPTVNPNRILTYDEEERNTLNDPTGPEIKFDPILNSIFGELPQTVLEDIKERKDITDRTNFFMQEAIKSKVDTPNYSDQLPDIIDDEVGDNEEKIDILNNLILSTDTQKIIQDFSNNNVDTVKSNITGQAINEAIQNQAWDFRNNDEMVENNIKVLNEDDAKSISTLTNNIIAISGGVANWMYFAKWLSEEGGLDALNDNFMTINAATGEIFLNGENIISENLYRFISCMVDENRQEIQHIWEYGGNLAGFINYRNTKVTSSNDHDTDYMPHLKFLIARYNLENPNTSIFFRHTQTADIKESIRTTSKIYPDTFVAKMFDFYNSGNQQDIIKANLQNIMMNLNVLNREYSSILTQFINIISRLLHIQPRILEHTFFKPLKQMLSSKFSNEISGKGTGEQLVQYFTQNKTEFAHAFLHCWYNSGKVPPHRETIVSLIPDIDQRELEPSKLFENYQATGIGGVTTIPAILNTIMSFLISDNLNDGWGGLLSLGINSWYNNLSYDSLNGSRDLELTSIRQIIEGFSEFIDRFVESFLPPIEEEDSIDTLKYNDDWITDISYDDNDNDNDDSPDGINVSMKIEDDDNGNDPFNFPTDRNKVFREGEEIMNIDQAVIKSKSKKWNNPKDTNSNLVLKDHRIKTNIKKARDLREKNRNVMRGIDTISSVKNEDNKGDIIIEENKYTDTEVQKKIREFNDRQLLDKIENTLILIEIL